MRCDIEPYKGFPPKMPNLNPKLGDRPMDYLARIADLCKKNDIELVLMKAPIEYPAWYEEWDAQISAFAAERGITYINYMGNEDIGLDMSVDTYDAGLHLNITGAEKFSVYLGKYLKDNFRLTDYRTDEQAAGLWQSKIEYYDSMRQKQLDEMAANGGKLISFGANATN